MPLELKWKNTVSQGRRSRMIVIPQWQDVVQLKGSESFWTTRHFVKTKAYRTVVCLHYSWPCSRANYPDSIKHLWCKQMFSCFLRHLWRDKYWNRKLCVSVFHHIPIGSEVYINLVFGIITFKFLNPGETLQVVFVPS